MKKLFLLAFCSLLIPLGARAQQAPLVVATCGTQSLTPGASAREYIDVTGNLCSSATGGGGGGGAITAAAGSYAAGAFSVGAGTDGWDVTKGIKSQGACASDVAACSLLERLSRVAVNLTTLNTTTSGPANLAAAATGGASRTGFLVPNNTTGVSIKGSAGTLYSVQLGGVGSVPAWLKIYDSASAPTCGSGTPVKRLLIPANSTPTLGGGSNIIFGPFGFALTTGIGYCVTGGIADADTTAPAASTYVVNFDWN